MSDELSKREQEIVYNSGSKEVRISPDIVKKYLVRGNKTVTNQEVFLFMQLCKFNGLNPFLNEAYLVKFGADAQMIVGKEAFMKRAESSKKYKGFKAGVIIKRDNEIIEEEGSFLLKGDILLGGWAEVFRKDREIPIRAKINLLEYDKKMSTWKSHPATMARKTALVQALREAFPKKLGGMYTEEDGEFLNSKIKKPVKKKKKSEFEKAFKKAFEKEEIEDIVEDAEIVSEDDEDIASELFGG